MDLQSWLQQAKELHRRGNVAAAEQLYLQVLQADPVNSTARHFLGILRSQQGRSSEAIELIGKAVEANPSDVEAQSSYGQVLMIAGRFAEALQSFNAVLAFQPELPQALYNRGVSLAMLERFDEALASFDKALAISSDLVMAWINRGNALRSLKRFQEALISYDKALLITPNDPGTHYNRALVLVDMERFEEAIRSYDKALALHPKFETAWNNRGLALQALTRFEEALDSYDRALAFRQNDVAIWNSRASVLRMLGRLDESLASYDRAVALQPTHVSTLINRGAVLRDLARFEQALASYDRAISLDPENALTWNCRGMALADMKRFNEAIASHSRAIALRPDCVEALHDRGYLLWSEMGRYHAAVADLERAVAAGPTYSYSRGELLHVKMHGAEWRDFEREKAVIDQGVREGHLVVQPFAYQAISASPADLHACSRIFAALFPYAPAPTIPVNCKHAKIRVGYVSADFREQATAYLAVGLYELHDKVKFEIIAFDNSGDDGSPIRRRLEAAFDKFVDISKLSNKDAADEIRQNEIDILVNLNGYFGSDRMGVFARRPAPIQVNYLGFPATLGAAYMDYIIADRIVIPDEDRRHYTEQVVWMPNTYQVNDSKRLIADEIPNRTAHGLPADAFIFCNFNQSYKLTPVIFAAWMRILNQVPGSVLWLLAGTSSFRENLRREAQHCGVAPERLVFASRVAVDKHLARLKLADLFLDTLPYNAHTTASDALWAGLPLITCRGSTFPGRVAASLLLAVGLPELVTENLNDYEKLAIAVARDNVLLRDLRLRLAKNRLNCALFDTDRFRRDIESVYKTMYDLWRRGEAPRHFG